LQLGSALGRLAAQGVRVEFEEARLLDHLVAGIQSERHGARGIAWLLETRLLQPIALVLLAREGGGEAVAVLDDRFYERGEIALSASSGAVLVNK
jgi:ATP-dependent Clp protease ATP-binding subunit ClpA